MDHNRIAHLRRAFRPAHDRYQQPTLDKAHTQAHQPIGSPVHARTIAQRPAMARPIVNATARNPVRFPAGL